MSDLPVGTIFLSRNLDNKDNRGGSTVINHACVYIGDNKIVESQKDQGGVVITPLSVYEGRKYNYFVIYPRDKAIGQKAAEVAKTLVGKKYSLGSSYRPRLYTGKLKGLSCVSVVDLSYSGATNKKLHLRTPDDCFTKYSDLFTTNITKVK